LKGNLTKIREKIDKDLNYICPKKENMIEREILMKLNDEMMGQYDYDQEPP